MEPKTDDDLVRDAREGDADAAELLVRRHAGAITAFAHRLTGRAGDGEDLMQETFARFFGAISAYRPEGKLRAYLFRITANLAANRRGAHRPEALDDAVADPAPGPDRVAATRELGRDVRRALGRLPDEQREALILKTWHELPYDEIARIQQATVAAVKVRVFRAREMLRSLLGGAADRPGTGEARA